MYIFQAPAESAVMEQSTGLFDNTSEMFRISLVSLLAVLGVAILGGLSYHFLIYVPRRKRGKRFFVVAVVVVVVVLFINFFDVVVVVFFLCSLDLRIT